MNNEPVAWRTHYPSGWEYKDGNPPFELKGNSQLLYTHPAKTLTDEEILNVAFCSEVNTVAIENDWDGTVIDFARAILKKASEK
jgi:hypothetical protein